MRIAVAEDKALIEHIVNHPELRKFNSHDGAPFCDAAKYLKSPSFVLIGNEGCFLLKAVGPCRYDVHTNLLPECRGRDALDVARYAMDLVFSRTDAEELYTMVPANNPAAAWFTKAMGFRFRFKRERVWLQGGVSHDARYYSITVDDWVLRGSRAGVGRIFHERLHSKAPQLDKHSDDPVHDAYVGAAISMMNKQPVKALSLYNRWARFAGYEPIEVVSKDPLVVDIKSCSLKFENGTFAVEVR